MIPPIFALCSADTTLQGLLTTYDGHFALYPFGEAPQLVARPYVVWQIVDGEPENYLGDAPDMDAMSIQLDVYAAEAADAREVATALRAVVEIVAHVVRYNGEWRDPETRAYRCSFTVDWLIDRQ